MKKLFCIYIWFFIFSNLFAQTASLKIVLENGIEYTESFDKESKSIVLISKENFRRKKLVDIQGLEQFDKLTDFCMYFFQYEKDYSFLKKIRKLKVLSLIDCGADTLTFLEELGTLEKFEVELNIQKENRYGVESTEVDFGKLSNLKEITFSIKYMEGTKFCNFINHLPPFVNIHTNPVLKIYAQEIKNLTDKDYEYAKQYSQIKPNYPYPEWPFN